MNGVNVLAVFFGYTQFLGPPKYFFS